MAIEDNPVGALLLKRTLAAMDFEVLGPYARGEDALEALQGMRACPPDAAVVDIYLAGELDGLQVARRLYDEFGVPAILASEARHEDLPDQVAPCGAWSFVSKPVEPTSLGVALELAMRRMVMEKRILASEARHRRLFENSPIGLFEADLDGRLLRVNPAMASMLGYASPEEAVELIRDLGERLFDDLSQAATFLGEMRAAGRTEPLIVELLGRDGELLNVELQGALGESVEAKALACGVTSRPLIEGAVQDVTARVEAEAQAASMRRIFERTVDSIGDHVALLDMDRRAMFVNAAMRAYYGFGGQLGEDAGDFSLPEVAYGGHAPRPECPHLAAMRSGGQCEVEYLDQARDRILRIASFPFLDNDGEVIGSVHLARDVTGFKRR